MHKVTCVIAVVVMAISMITVSADADTQRDEKPRFTKGKFALPVNPDEVKAAWAAYGYSSVRQVSYFPGRGLGNEESLSASFLGNISAPPCAMRVVGEASPDVPVSVSSRQRWCNTTHRAGARVWGANKSPVVNDSLYEEHR